MDKKILTRENSKAVLQDYNLTVNEQSLFPNYDLHNASDLIFSDPVVNGAEKHFVDKCSEGGFNFVKKTSMELHKEVNDLMNYELNFEVNVLRSVFVQAFRYRNAFLEVVKGKGSGKIIGFNVLDARNIRPVTKPNGDVEKYRWKIQDPVTKKYPEWKPEEVIWLKFYDTATGWSGVDLKSVYKWVHTKSMMHRYVQWLWKTGQYRVLYNFTDARNSDVVEDFLTFMEAHDHDPTVPFITRGEVRTMLTRDMKETDSYIGLFKYIDSQILINLRVPPIDAGIPDASGRSNADAQSNNFATTIKGIKTVVKGAINTKILPYMGFEDTCIVFAPNDRFQKKQIIDELNILHNIGLSKEAKLEYLNRNGIFFQTKEVFQEEEEQVEGEKDIDLMPSRFTGEGSGMNVEGTGEASSTREDQLRS